MKIIFGGSFDPIHNGHLRIATELSELFAGARVDLVPCKVPLHKASLNVSAEQRLTLIRAAIKDDPRLAVNGCELERQGRSDSYTTLKELRAERYNPVVMAIGTDSALDLGAWHKAKELAGLCHLVILKRPDYNDAALIAQLEGLGFGLASERSELENNSFGRVLFLDVTQLQISSSVIRRKIAQNLSIKYLVPDAVHQIICNNQLYSNPLS